MEKKKSDSLIPILQKGIQEYLKKYFSVRIKLCEEIFVYLDEIPPYRLKLIKGIKDIHSEFKIPELIPEKDMRISAMNEHTEIWDSSWLLDQPKNTRDKFHSDIIKLIREMGFPLSFYQWLKDYVIYNKEPDDKPGYNLSMLEHLRDYSSGDLTKGEKELLEKDIRSVFRIKGRPKNDIKKDYSEIKEEIDEMATCEIKPFKSLDTAIKTLEIGKKEVVKDELENREIVRKKQYLHLACEIDEDEKYFGQEEVLIQRLRKQRERLLERIKAITKVEF